MATLKFPPPHANLATFISYHTYIYIYTMCVFAFEGFLCGMNTQCKSTPKWKVQNCVGKRQETGINSRETCGNTQEKVDISWQKAEFNNSAFEGLEHICCSLFVNFMNQEVSTSALVGGGCEILRCETMSLRNDMRHAIMEETAWPVLGRQW